LTRAQRGDHDGDVVAVLDHVELPPEPIEDAGVRALDRPVAHLAFRIRCAQVDIDVRVLPAKLRDLARQLDLLLVVEHRERMMGGSNAGKGAGGQREQGSEFHGSPDLDELLWPDSSPIAARRR
jgi:hypothetical protein